LTGTPETEGFKGPSFVDVVRLLGELTNLSNENQKLSDEITAHLFGGQSEGKPKANQAPTPGIIAGIADTLNSIICAEDLTKRNLKLVRSSLSK